MIRKTLMSLALLIALAALVISPLASGPASTATAQDTTRVRLAVIPVLDTLPLFIAEENGYFEEAGIDIELIPVVGPVERDQLIQAGEADGMITDIPGVGFFNEVRTRIQIVYTTRVAVEDGPIFRILAAPGSDIATVEDLSGVSIGVSEATIIEYLTFRLLERAGVDDIETEAVPAIPVRFQLLMAGELRAATLPDPLAQAAIVGGAIAVVDDTALESLELSQSVLVFNVDFIDDNPEAVTAFISAWDRAVVDLNADPEAYRQLFLDRTVVPETVEDTYEIPPFPRGMITSEFVWDDYMDWMLDQEIIEDEPDYDDSVNDDLLPEFEGLDDDMDDMDDMNGDDESMDDMDDMDDDQSMDDMDDDDDTNDDQSSDEDDDDDEDDD